MPDAHYPPFSEYVHERDITVVTDEQAGVVRSRLFRGRVSLAVAFSPGGPRPLWVVVRAPPGQDAWACHTGVVQQVREGKFGG